MTHVSNESKEFEARWINWENDNLKNWLFEYVMLISWFRNKNDKKCSKFS